MGSFQNIFSNDKNHTSQSGFPRRKLLPQSRSPLSTPPSERPKYRKGEDWPGCKLKGIQSLHSRVVPLACGSNASGFTLFLH